MKIGTDILEAKKFLENDELVAIPTETVYGLAGNALKVNTLSKIFSCKERPAFDPLIVHFRSIEAVNEHVVDLPEIARHLAEIFWPGPLTFILKKKDSIPNLATSGHSTVAVRVPKHPMTLRLLELLDFPLAAPSANKFGQVSPTKAEHVFRQLGNEIPYILDGGDTFIGLESTIIDLSIQKPEILRLGGVSVEALNDVLNMKLKVKTSSSNPKSPGMLQRHYSPGKNMILVDDITSIRENSYKNAGFLTFSYSDFSTKHHIALSPIGNIDEAARNLFSALNEIATWPVDVVYAELMPEVGLGRAINDRLKRASFPLE